MSFDIFEQITLAILLSMPRIFAAFLVIPFFSRTMLPGVIVKNGLVLAISVFMLPVNMENAAVVTLYSLNTMLVLVKELFIGLVIGFLVTIPFWAIESVGFFIDNQRGATMASSLNPLTGSQTSPLGILLNQAATTIFFVSGSFMLFLQGLYLSFKTWPLLSFFPNINWDVMDFFIGQIGYVLLLTVLLAAPVIVIMFIAEFCFALINRFTPQLNVFVLSMPVKSIVGIFIMILYLLNMFIYLKNEVGIVSKVFTEAARLFQ